MHFKAVSAASLLLALAEHTRALPAAVSPGQGISARADLPSQLFSDQTSNGSIFQFGNDASCRQLFYTHGSCGLSTYFADKIHAANDLALVAIPNAIMNQYGASQYNTLCGKTIIITGPNGVEKKAAIADTNVGGDNSIDMCLNLWEAFGHQDNDGSIFTGANSLKWKVENA